MKQLTFLILIATALILTTQLSAQNEFVNTYPCPIITASGEHTYLRGDVCFPSSTKSLISTFPPVDQIPLVQIGTLVAPMYQSMAGGDSDEDGLFEAAMYIKDNAGGWTFTYRLYEDDGTNSYNQVFQSNNGLIPYAFGDTDGDSLMEFIGQDGYYIYVYESPSPGQLASQPVWQSPMMTNVVGYTTIGDLDQDGRMEIIHTQNSFGSNNRLTIFEAIGNNIYQQIYDEWYSDYPAGTKAIGDFDGDGLMELAFSNLNGDVLVYESTGNDSLQLIFFDNMNTANAYACCSADDMDGNGRLEFVCSGSAGDTDWINRIYEAVENDSFVMRQEIIIDDNHFGSPGNATGDVDGDGTDELIIQVAEALHIYKWDGIEWAHEETIPEIPNSSRHGVFIYDSNHNGYDDVFWLGIGDGGYWEHETILLESEDAQVPPDITVILTPEITSIEIPTSGGSFDFNLTVTYNETPPQAFDGWIMIMDPDSMWHGPVMDPLTLLPMAPGTTYEQDTTYVVEAGFDTGQYVFEARIGYYPDDIWDADAFPYSIVPGSAVEPNLTNITPKEFAILGNYPNPFNPTTIIKFALPEAAHVTLEIYDVTGRHVNTLFNGTKEAGNHRTIFDGSHLCSGIYYVNLQAGDFQETWKLVLLK